MCWGCECIVYHLLLFFVLCSISLTYTCSNLAQLVPFLKIWVRSYGMKKCMKNLILQVFIFHPSSFTRVPNWLPRVSKSWICSFCIVLFFFFPHNDWKYVYIDIHLFVVVCDINDVLGFCGV